MTMTIELSDATFEKLKALSVVKGCSPECMAENLVLENLPAVPSAVAPKRAQMTDEELDAHLVAHGCIVPDRSAAKGWLERSRLREDLDPDGTEEEWAQILKNIEEGTIELRRVEV